VHRRAFLGTMAGGLLAAPLSAEAQAPAKVPRIGFLSARPATDNPKFLESFRQGLRELGYVEGQNIAIEYRFAEGRPERLPVLAAELVRLKVDVIVTGGPPLLTQPSRRPARSLSSSPSLPTLLP
jgi:putative ABC transport system substrate-binding protein